MGEPGEVGPDGIPGEKGDAGMVAEKGSMGDPGTYSALQVGCQFANAK